jgi:hypothetical protein
MADRGAAKSAVGSTGCGLGCASAAAGVPAGAALIAAAIGLWDPPAGLAGLATLVAVTASCLVIAAAGGVLHRLGASAVGGRAGDS